MLATLSFVVASGAVHYAPVVDDDGEVASFSDEPAAGAAFRGEQPADPFAAAVAPARKGARPSARPSAEQQNVARFIASRYRLAADQTQDLVEQAYKIAREAKLDPWLVLAVISVESSFNPKAQSNKGAQGLMQVLTRVHAEKFAPFGGVAAAFDPLANMRVGTQILKQYLVRAEGSVEEALKSYVGAALLPHDGGYGAKVLFERERIAAAAAGRAQPVRPAANVARAEPPRQAEAMRAEMLVASARPSGEAADHAAPRTADVAFRPWVEVAAPSPGEAKQEAAPDPVGLLEKDRLREI